MKKVYISLLMGASLVLFDSCSVPNQLSSDKKIRISLLAGSNIGGITENTDMTVVPGAEAPPEATVDAFTGATKGGFNAGIHTNMPLKRNEIETGVDYMYNHQTFTYADAGNMYIGVRELKVSQLMFPVTYNFVLFRKLLPNASIQLKIGYLGQLNFVSTSSTGILPDYSINRWSNGVTFGMSAFPFQFNTGCKLGIYLDAYRGTQIYEDYYNQTSFEMPGSSFIKFGLKYQF